MPRKTLQEKLNREAEIVEIPPKAQKRFGVGKMLIPAPRELEALIRQIPKGKLATQTQLREYLAQKYGVLTTCPITTGIFVRLLAEEAEEMRSLGKKRITPYWRVLKADGRLNEKYPGGIEAHKRLLEQEGHSIEPQRGKKPPRVVNYETKLFSFK